MATDFKKELNPYFEIIGLLYSCNHSIIEANESMEKLIADLGIDGSGFQKKVMVALKKYISTFQKSMIQSDKECFDFFFSEEDSDFVVAVQYVFSSHPEWFESSIEHLTEKEILTDFVEVIFDDDATMGNAPSFTELVEALRRTGLSANTCWKLMLMFQSPKEHVEKLSNIVNNNRTAYENAINAVRTIVEKQLDKFQQGKFFCTSLHQDASICPTFIYPVVELVNVRGAVTSSYIGLFTDDVYKMQEKSKAVQNNILPMLKAISDNSKFDILLSLRRAPKYNLELAAELNLTPATISHHMNVLLASQLVTVEKKDGRIYYIVSKETIEKLIVQLRNKLLD